MDTPERPHQTDRTPPSRRTLRVLRAVIDHPDSPTKRLLRILANRGDIMSDQTLRNHLEHLTDEQWIVRDHFGQYGLSPKSPLWQLALLDTAPIDFAAAEPILRKYADYLGASVLLSSFDEDDSVRVVAHSDAPGVVYIEDIIEGLPDAAHCTALGRALAATLQPSERRDYFHERGLRPFTTETVRTFDDLNEVLVKAERGGGIYREYGETIPDIACTAVLARKGVARRDRFALAIAQRDGSVTRDERSTVRALRACAAALAPVLKADYPLPEVPR